MRLHLNNLRAVDWVQGVGLREVERVSICGCRSIGARWRCDCCGALRSFSPKCVSKKLGGVDPSHDRFCDACSLESFAGPILGGTRRI